jgi:hypothetical protein
VTDCCEHGTELSGSLKRRNFLAHVTHTNCFRKTLDDRMSYFSVGLAD